MGAQYLIDSNAAIDYLGGKLPKSSIVFMNEIVDAIPNVSVITKIEVLGFKSSPEDYQLLLDFFEDAIIFELVPEIVDKAIELRKAYKIKLGDSIIAATASVYDLNIITRNVNDFRQIMGIHVVNPYEI